MKPSENKTFPERRKHQRYRTNDGAFAAVSPNSYKLGQIVNISRGGLAFQYIETKTKPTHSEERYIFLSSKGYYVREIPFKQISDKPIPNANPYSTLNMRQCAIQFGEMNMEQMIYLDNYILNNTDKYA